MMKIKIPNPGKAININHNMTSQFVHSTDEKWQQVKEAAQHDFYHLPEYVKLDADQVGGKAVCWIMESDSYTVWIPLIERKLPDNISKGKNYYDLTSPYGYPGILFDRPVFPHQLNDVIRRFKNDAGEHNYITTFIRMNPIINPFSWQQDDLIRQRYHGFTITVPLFESFQIIRKGYSQNHRKNIRQLNNDGFTFSINSHCSCKEFISIYIQTMDRLNASDYYYFSEDYFHSLFEILDDKLLLALVHSPDGKAVSGGLLTDFNGIIQSHLTATRTAYLEHAPSKLLFDGIIQQAVNMERKWLHLGGGLNSREDSLYRFKKGFSPIKNQFSTLRIIHDKQRYNNLNYVALNESGKDKFEDMEFFPLYRHQF